jgi:6-phosphogluconate dehydrogenase
MKRNKYISGVAVILFLTAVLSIWIYYSCHINLSSGYLCRRTRTVKNFGFVGLGEMGMGMAGVISGSGITVFGTDINPDARNRFSNSGSGIAAADLEDMVKKMGEGRKVIWLMVPHGDPLKENIETIVSLRDQGLLQEGDIIIDGGNSNHITHREYAAMLAQKGVILLDVGTSGGTSAAGDMSLMVSGDFDAYSYCLPLFEALAMEGGHNWFGEAGAGHFVKSVHNGIEYVLFQLLAESVEVLANYFGWDQDKVASVINSFANSSLLNSWTLELAEEALRDDGFFSVAPHIFGGSTGTWTQEDAESLGVSASLLKATLQTRIASRSRDIENYQLKPGDFAYSLVALIRNKMGSHKYDEQPIPVSSQDYIDTLGIGSERIDIAEDEFVDIVLAAVTYSWLMVYKEGFEIIAASRDYHIDTQGLADLSTVWQNGAVIRSDLLGLIASSFHSGEDVETVFQSLAGELGISIDSVRIFREIAEILGVPVPVFSSINP